MQKDDKFTISLAERPLTGDAEPDPVVFIGTANTLIHYGGFTILTDPNFLHAGEHAKLGYSLTAERLTNPALEIEQLPPLDVCVPSHYHGDHWDEVASEKLRKDLPIITTPQAAAAIEKEGFHDTRGLSTCESCVVRREGRWLRVTAMPGRHVPPVVNFALPKVNGRMLEWDRDSGRDSAGEGDSPALFRMYISGDTLVYDDLMKIPRCYPEIPVALLHLVGTKVMGVLVTMDANQGI